MARTHVAIAVAGMFFAGFSGTSQAAPMAPLAGADTLHTVPATQASWQADWHGDWHGDRHRDLHGHDRFGGFLGHRRSEGRHGGIMSRFGGMRSIMAMMGRMGGSDGGGGLSMLNAIGGMGGMQSMMSAMSGIDSGGMEQMLGTMGGGMGGSGGMQAMIGAMGGGGMTGGGGHASESARQACTPDAMRLCSDAIPDVAKVKACMQAKSSQLSEPCRAAMNGAGSTQPASAGREFAGSAGSRDFSNFTPRQRFANGGAQGFDNFRGGRDYDNFQGYQSNQGYQSYQGYDSSGGVQAFGGRGYDNFEGGGYGGGRGDINVGQLMGMARSMGFGGHDGW
jgi:hypothetical protein